MRLFVDRRVEGYWFAQSASTGWVRFPAVVGGWEKHEPAMGLDPLYLREVPIRQGFNTGIPGAPGTAAVTVLRNAA
ncbi:MAG: hypothetical protein ABI759_16225 [Candidatus Solibacter sp.]